MRREVAPTAWELLLREARAGVRRWAGVQRGEHYQQLLAHLGEGEHESPAPYERLLGDLVDPTRPGRFVDVLNAVSRRLKLDVGEWGVDRILSMVGQIEADPSPQLPE